MANLSDVMSIALSLEVRDRAALAERLLASLDQLTEEETERLWAEEAERRLDDYHSGKAKAISADEVHAKAERLYQ